MEVTKNWNEPMEVTKNCWINQNILFYFKCYSPNYSPSSSHTAAYNAEITLQTHSHFILFILYIHIYILDAYIGVYDVNAV